MPSHIGIRFAASLMILLVADLMGCAQPQTSGQYQTQYLGMLEESFNAGRINRASYEGERARVLEHSRLGWNR